jgi:8-oxo-dGTP pyrophosphatase MutT (NUDIX family)
MRRSYAYCNNCKKQGHGYYQCKTPIISLGIIAYRTSNSIREYLMICRKDTLGFIDFMRGKYSLNNKAHLQDIINEMTITEKQNLQKLTFSQLWKILWGEFIGMQYRKEEFESSEKFYKLKNGVYINNELVTLNMLLEKSTTAFKEPEWGFPKGRRNYQEKDLSCALREFEEETGYSCNQLKLINNIIPFEEIFIGSNNKAYKHKYFLAYMHKIYTTDTAFQQCEVSKLQWLTYDECIQKIRSYNLEKKKVLTNIDNLLNNSRLYS